MSGRSEVTASHERTPLESRKGSGESGTCFSELALPLLCCGCLGNLPSNLCSLRPGARVLTITTRASIPHPVSSLRLTCDTHGGLCDLSPRALNGMHPIWRSCRAQGESAPLVFPCPSKQPRNLGSAPEVRSSPPCYLPVPVIACTPAARLICIATQVGFRMPPPE